MNKNYEKSAAVPSAPTAPHSDVMQYSNRAPPPSYEESVRMQANAAPAYYPPGPAPPQYIASGYDYPSNYVPQPNRGPVLYPSQFQGNFAPVANTNIKPVIELAKGATVRTTSNGAVSIPPPPPGVAATPGQLAAMNGQPVFVKTQKRGFF